MKKVLITGFNPFNKEKINPSYEAVKKLEDRIDGYEIIKKEIPTEYEKSIEVLNRLIDEEKPNIVILVGQAGGATSITLERIGINFRDASIEDNKGKKYKGEKIYEDGDDGYFSTLPLDKIEARLKRENIPVVQSNSAGTFVCNNLLYNLIYKIRKEKLDIIGGFIHVPFIIEQAIDNPNRPSMDLEKIVDGLREIIKASIK